MANEKRLIDANKVIGAMQKCLDESPDKKDSVAYFAFESIIECLKQEPTVDAVEVVHGRFESVRYGYGCLQIATCSVCGEKQGLYINGRLPNWNYCPNCGAKMDGERREGE